MIIVVRNEARVEAELSEEELSALGITYDEFDYADMKTRRVLRLIADEIRKSGAADIDFSGRLLIEVMKRKSGNVLICFTCLSVHCGGKSVKQLVKSTEEPLVLEAGIDELCAAAEASCIKEPCSLYENDGIYRLVFYADTDKKNLFSAMLAEFGELKRNSRIEYARCAENWRLIAKDNALSVLSLIS